MLTKDEGEKLFNWIQKILILNDPDLRNFTIKKAIKQYTEQVTDAPQLIKQLDSNFYEDAGRMVFAIKINELIDAVNLLIGYGDNNNE